MEIETRLDRLAKLFAALKSQAQILISKRVKPVLYAVISLFIGMVVIVIVFWRSLAPAPSGLPNNEFDIATRAYQRGEFGTALAALDHSDKSNPARAESLDLRGCVLLEQQRYDEAKAAFEAAHTAAPELFAPRLHLGDLFLRQKKYVEAREVYQQLIKETNILMANERLRFGVMLTYLGEHDEVAAKKANEAIKFPTESGAYYFAQAAWAFAHNKTLEGEYWIRKAQGFYQSDTTAWFAHHLYHFGWLKKKPPLTVSQP